MEAQIIFAQEIYIDTLDFIECDQLKKVILKMKAESAGVNVSNVLGWQSDSLTDKSVGYENFSLLIETVKDKVNEIVHNRFSINKEIKLHQFWLNVNGKNAYNNEHAHAVTLFSAVFYVEHEPNMGDLVLLRGNNELEMFNSSNNVSSDSPITGTQYNFIPRKNKLVIFPGWYRHRVEMNKSDKERISVAMNFSF
jgi:uncharacterized protein (TIGR02466 family)